MGARSLNRAAYFVFNSALRDSYAPLPRFFLEIAFLRGLMPYDYPLKYRKKPHLGFRADVPDVNDRAARPDQGMRLMIDVGRLRQL